MWRARAGPPWSGARRAPVEHHTWGGAQLHLTAVYLCVYPVPCPRQAVSVLSVCGAASMRFTHCQ